MTNGENLAVRPKLIQKHKINQYNSSSLLNAKVLYIFGVVSLEGDEDTTTIVLLSTPTEHLFDFNERGYTLSNRVFIETA